MVTISNKNFYFNKILRKTDCKISIINLYIRNNEIQFSMNFFCSTFTSQFLFPSYNDPRRIWQNFSPPGSITTSEFDSTMWLEPIITNDSPLKCTLNVASALHATVLAFYLPDHAQPDVYVFKSNCWNWWIIER